ncbi:MAG: hypothetical protein WCF33_21575 [Pseudonocardiaceae bacterium]
MSKVTSQIIEAMTQRFGPIPQSFTFGDGIDWSSSLAETSLYVELPFWLMTPPGPVDVEWSGTMFTIDVCSPWMEVFGGEVTDSRSSVVHHGPWRPDGWQPPQEIAEELARLRMSWIHRPCKSVLRLTAQAHSSAFHVLDDSEPPRAHTEQRAYWASLCQAHLPGINELVQRYRLLTYDYFAYEVSPWDVPVWYLKHAGVGYRAVLLPYKEWDAKPVTVEDGDTPGGPPKVRQFEWTTPSELATTSSTDATPGEFDLLDARSMMQRGDYTGAIRRTVTAVEAVLRWALLAELEMKYPSEEVERRTANTDNDFPGRLAQWRKLAKPQIAQQEFDEFQATRETRHAIVHRAYRLTHQDREHAQRAVDTGRWLYNKIERKPDRARLRDYGVLKSAGRTALAPRFPSTLDAEGITLRPFTAPSES